MLTITPDALSVIRRVTAHPGLDPSPGIRIAPRKDPAASLEVRIVPRPQPGDRVVERNGGRLYVAPSAARRVADRELDVVTDLAGRVQFVARKAG